MVVFQLKPSFHFYDFWIGTQYTKDFLSEHATSFVCAVNTFYEACLCNALEHTLNTLTVF